MHELSIAYSLVETAQAAAQQANAQGVKTVYLRLGALAGVVEEALQFGWEIATADTLLAGATLAIERVPLVVYCPHCAQAVALPSTHYFRCPVCDTPTPQVVSGKELELLSMEVFDADQPA